MNVMIFLDFAVLIWCFKSQNNLKVCLM